MHLSRKAAKAHFPFRIEIHGIRVSLFYVHSRKKRNYKCEQFKQPKNTHTHRKRQRIVNTCVKSNTEI